MPKFTLTYATRYNGVSINANHDLVDVTDEVDGLMDKVGDTFPDYTYKWAMEDWDHQLKKEYIDKLKEMTVELLRPAFADLTVEDIGFEYDEFSS